MQAALKQRIRDWLPVVLWLGVLILESTDLMSSQHTGGLLHRMITAVFGQVDEARFEALHHLLRKAGHFLGYGILCLLLFRALRDTFGGTVRRWAAIALTLTFLVALLDEVHQRFLSSRSGRFQDVLIDTCGALFLQMLVLLVLRRRERRQKSELKNSNLNLSSTSGKAS